MGCCVADVGYEVYAAGTDERGVEGGEVVGRHEDDPGGGRGDPVEGVEKTREGYAGLIAGGWGGGVWERVSDYGNATGMRLEAR